MVFTGAQIRNVLIFFGVVLLCFIAFNFSREETPNVVYNVLQSSSSEEYSPVCMKPGLETSDQFKNYFTAKEFICTNFKYFGKGDGSKGVCLDPEFELIPGSCNVLSFGINRDWSFDDAFGKFGCKVYAFDPTNRVKEHKRSENVYFYSLGIAGFSGRMNLGKSKNCKVDRYENILKKVGWLDQPIHYLKMDVEFAEIDFFQDLFRNSAHLVKNIRQIGMEVHYSAGGADSLLTKMFWQYFQELKCHGFKIMDSRQYKGRSEIVWVRP